jgi:hypothetical protein
MRAGYARYVRGATLNTFHDLGIVIRQNGRVEQRVDCRCGPGKTMGVNIETGVFHCFRCGWSGRAGNAETREARPIICRPDPREAERKRKRLIDTWAGCVQLTDSAARPVQAYLQRRGLSGLLSQDIPQNLRAHPALKYYDDEGREVGLFAAMVGLLQDLSGRGATLHITYLNRDGTKAPVSSPKKLLPPAIRGATRGSAIRLYQPKNGVLGIAEGIENALSLHLIQSIPTWSAFCADNLASVQLPPLSQLYITLDIDGSGTGERVARVLTRRAQTQGIQVRHVIPDGEGPRDLNDELRRRIN